MKLCYKCQKRPAVVFISEINGVQSNGSPKGLCLVCAKEAGIQPINDMLEKMNISDDDIDEISNQFMDIMALNEENSDDDDSFMPGGAATFPFLNNIFGNPNKSANNGNTETENNEKNKDKNKKNKKKKFLEQFCTNLTEKARNGELDRVVGRGAELHRTIQILSRRTKNNPCLIGEPGVGKTAIAEGLALMIANKTVPARLQDKEIHLLDLTGLVAGTQFRGQFESRIKNLIDEVKAAGNIILFIDEVHNLVGAGDSEGSMSAGNIMKPALSRGEIQVIGATTFNEYRKYIEKDAALERRFQSVTIDEPSIEDAIDVLMGVKSYYEGYHGVTVGDDIVRNAVILSERYINDRFLPDKAIDLLDEACACACLRNKAIDKMYIANKKVADLSKELDEVQAEVETPDYEKIAMLKFDLEKYKKEVDELCVSAADNSVTGDDLAEVIELWTGIPAVKVKQNNLEKLAKLENNLKKRIIGQDKAVKAVALGVRRSGVQISSHRRPASFIFVGPTGVGKTELVKVLSEELFNTPETLIRLDMSEFMEKHSVSKLIGAPPGYVGFDDAGQLTEKVRRKPYSVILFDEIEKAHPDVLNILLQILDDGRATDSQGRKVSFENTVIVMTSNAGSNNSEMLLGFNKTESDASKEKCMKALEEFLRPEFLGRVDDIIVFSPLSKDSLKQIAALIIDELVKVLAEKNIIFKYDDKVCKYLADKCNSKSGARELRKNIRKEIEDKIISLIIDNPTMSMTEVTAKIENKSIKIDYKF